MDHINTLNRMIYDNNRQRYQEKKILEETACLIVEIQNLKDQLAEIINA